MRALIIAGALAAAATTADAAEPAAACYDAAVIGMMIDYANDSHLDSTPVPADRILPRVQADTLIYTRAQVAGPKLPKEFWARAILTEAPDPSPMLLIYLKTQPDGVPSVVGYRLAPPFYRLPALADHRAC